MLAPVTADLLCLCLGDNGNADFHKGCAIIIAKAAFDEIIPIQLGEIIRGYGIFCADASAVFVDIDIDFVFHLIGNAVDEVIDNLLAVIRQGVACVILLARFFQPAGAFQLGKILLYGEIVHIVFFQKELANFAIREGNSHFLQEMQNNQLMLCQLFCGILHGQNLLSNKVVVSYHSTSFGLL